MHLKICVAQSRGGKRENKLRKPEASEESKKKNARYSPIMKMGMVKEKGERLFIREVKSVATCTSSQKNVMREIRMVNLAVHCTT